MSERMLTAIRAYREATSTFLDALEAEVAARWKTGTAKLIAPADTVRARPRMARTALPTPLTPAPRPGVVLSDETRAENLPAAIDLAMKVLAIVGDGPTLRDSVIGQCAMERLSYDAELIDQAIAGAQAQLPSGGHPSR